MGDFGYSRKDLERETTIRSSDELLNSARILVKKNSVRAEATFNAIVRCVRELRTREDIVRNREVLCRLPGQIQALIERTYRENKTIGTVKISTKHGDTYNSLRGEELEPTQYWQSTWDYDYGCIFRLSKILQHEQYTLEACEDVLRELRGEQPLSWVQKRMREWYGQEFYEKMFNPGARSQRARESSQKLPPRNRSSDRQQTYNQALDEAYETFSLPRDATKTDIQKRYHHLAKQYHPDKSDAGSRNAAEKYMQIINAYYNLLIQDAARRAGK